MKPEELLMQYYQYWTQPTDGPAHIKPPEDHEGTIEALRIGAEAIKEVERLRSKSQTMSKFEGSHWSDCWRTHHECAMARLEDIEVALRDTGFSSLTDLLRAYGELDNEAVALKAEVERLRARFPQYTCHVCWTTSCEPVETEDECILEHPHEGEHLRCLCCSQTQWLKEKNERIAKLEAEAELHEDMTAEYAAKCSMLETANKLIAELEEEVKQLWSPLLPPTKLAREVFMKVAEKPDSDMRAVPNQWLKNERSMNSHCVDELQKENDDLRARVEQFKQRIAEFEAEKEARCNTTKETES